MLASVSVAYLVAPTMILEIQWQSECIAAFWVRGLRDPQKPIQQNQGEMEASVLFNSAGIESHSE